MRKESVFYTALFVIIIMGFCLRYAIFGTVGLILPQPASLGTWADSLFIGIQQSFIQADHAHPYFSIALVAVIAQLIAHSISFLPGFFLPQLKTAMATAGNRKGQALLNHYQLLGANPVWLIAPSLLRILALVMAVLLFIRPLSQAVPLSPPAWHIATIAGVYFSAYIPQILLVEGNAFEDSGLYVHVLVGIVCLFAPILIFVYFTSAACCQAFIFLAQFSTDHTHEKNPQSTC